MGLSTAFLGSYLIIGGLVGLGIGFHDYYRKRLSITRVVMEFTFLSNIALLIWVAVWPIWVAMLICESEDTQVYIGKAAVLDADKLNVRRQEMQPLSSRFIWFYRAVLPGAAFFGMCTFTFWEKAPIGDALVFFAAFVATSWFGGSLKDVELGSGVLRVGSMFETIDVPTSHLTGLVEHPWQRPRFVTLEFSPPTKWGQRIRMLTPIENFRSAVDTINTLVKRSSVPNQSTDPTLSSGTPAARQPARHP
jgi:hypothetical protein